MISIRRSIIIIKLLIIMLCLILIGVVVNKTLSRFETVAETSGSMQVAFYLINAEHQSETIQISSIMPSSEEYIYTFSVSNNDGINRTETSLEYDLSIITTTNLPLTYALYIEEEGQEVINAATNNQTIQDEYGTYFRVIETETKSFTHTEDETINYTLVITFPETYNSVQYQDVIEAIEIEIDSRQII